MVKEEKRLVIVKTSGVLHELNFITGPVLMPWYLPVSKISQLISNGREVWEVNPENRDERVKLTIKNLKVSNFGKQVSGTTTVEKSDKKENVTKTVVKDEKHNNTIGHVNKEVTEQPAVEKDTNKVTKNDFTQKK